MRAKSNIHVAHFFHHILSQLQFFMLNLPHTWGGKNVEMMNIKMFMDNCHKAFDLSLFIRHKWLTNLDSSFHRCFFPFDCFIQAEVKCTGMEKELK